jgi:hypothetical protein
VKSLLVTFLVGVAFWLGMAAQIGIDRRQRIEGIHRVADRPQPRPASYESPYYKTLSCEEQGRVCRARRRLEAVQPRNP